MTRRQIDAAHEVRMWIKDIILPVVTTGVFTVLMFPEAKQFVIDKSNNVKRWFNDRVKK